MRPRHQQASKGSAHTLVLSSTATMDGRDCNSLLKDLNAGWLRQMPWSVHAQQVGGSPQPAPQVACTTAGCPYSPGERQVSLRQSKTSLAEDATRCTVLPAARGSPRSPDRSHCDSPPVEACLACSQQCSPGISAHFARQTRPPAVQLHTPADSMQPLPASAAPALCGRITDAQHANPQTPRTGSCVRLGKENAGGGIAADPMSPLPAMRLPPRSDPVHPPPSPPATASHLAPALAALLRSTAAAPAGPHDEVDEECRSVCDTVSDGHGLSQPGASRCVLSPSSHPRTSLRSAAPAYMRPLACSPPRADQTDAQQRPRLRPVEPASSASAARDATHARGLARALAAGSAPLRPCALGACSSMHAAGAGAARPSIPAAPRVPTAHGAAEAAPGSLSSHPSLLPECSGDADQPAAASAGHLAALLATPRACAARRASSVSQVVLRSPHVHASQDPSCPSPGSPGQWWQHDLSAAAHGALASSRFEAPHGGSVAECGKWQASPVAGCGAEAGWVVGGDVRHGAGVRPSQPSPGVEQRSTADGGTSGLSQRHSSSSVNRELPGTAATCALRAARARDASPRSGDNAACWKVHPPPPCSSNPITCEAATPSPGTSHPSAPVPLPTATPPACSGPPSRTRQLPQRRDSSSSAASLNHGDFGMPSPAPTQLQASESPRSESPPAATQLQDTASLSSESLPTPTRLQAPTFPRSESPPEATQLQALELPRVKYPPTPTDLLAPASPHSTSPPAATQLQAPDSARAESPPAATQLQNPASPSSTSLAAPTQQQASPDSIPATASELLLSPRTGPRFGGGGSQSTAGTPRLWSGRPSQRSSYRGETSAASVAATERCTPLSARSTCASELSLGPWHTPACEGAVRRRRSGGWGTAEGTLAPGGSSHECGLLPPRREPGSAVRGGRSGACGRGSPDLSWDDDSETNGSPIHLSPGFSLEVMRPDVTPDADGPAKMHSGGRAMVAPPLLLQVLKVARRWRDVQGMLWPVGGLEGMLLAPAQGGLDEVVLRCAAVQLQCSTSTIAALSGCGQGVLDGVESSRGGVAGAARSVSISCANGAVKLKHVAAGILEMVKGIPGSEDWVFDGMCKCSPAGRLPVVYELSFIR